MATRCDIAVIGAGLMGHSIALTFARAGNRVRVFDPSAESLASLHERVGASLRGVGVADAEVDTILDAIEPASSLDDCVKNADFVTEAAPEKLELKQSIFAEVEASAPADCILASNTSVIPITSIMSGLKDPSRALGTHWWNPGHLIPLVEIVRTEWTSEESLEWTDALLRDAGKTPVRVEKDVPGFIGNRLQHALWREAISLVERGICDAEAVDTVIKSCFGRRLAVLGPLENADLVGTDLTLDIHRNVLFDLESRQGPSPYLEQLVAEGKLGMKTGEGFRRWTPEEAQAVRERVSSHLVRLGSILNE